MGIKQKIAVVTGGNRGIGKEICRQLALKDVLVVLTSRDEKKGMAAVDEFSKQELPIRYKTLDVEHAASIKVFARAMEDEFGRCDILINNAGIFPDASDASVGRSSSILTTEPDLIRQAMATNVFGPLLLCQALVPLMKRNRFGRIINISSRMGQLTYMNGGCPAYRISKTSLNAVTRILADELAGEPILVNSMCPGWVRTDMGGDQATRTVAEGADTAVWLALAPDGSPSGKFFRDRQEIPW